MSSIVCVLNIISECEMTSLFLVSFGSLSLHLLRLVTDKTAYSIDMGYPISALVGAPLIREVLWCFSMTLLLFLFSPVGHILSPVGCHQLVVVKNIEL